MRNWLSDSVIAGAAAAVLLLAAMPGAAQAPAYRAPRTADGKPNLNGIWQALNTADWDLQGHAAAKGPVPSLGAVFAVPPGLGVVEGDEIPYLPAAVAKKKANQANWTMLDPEAKCYLPGVPRATYLPHPFQIVQSQQNILISYEYAGAVRVINMGAPTKAPGDSWMGWSNGHWEGETLVVDVTSLMEDTWFDHAGNYHSDALHVVERYTPQSADTLNYEATIEDPKVFSRPWKISMPLYRHVEKNAKLLEYKCVEFAEELLYGSLRKKSSNQPVGTRGGPVSRRLLASTAALAAVALVALLAQATAAGQTLASATKATTVEKAWTPPHTPDGKPDLQGIWSDNTLTPFERPKSLGAKEFYTDKELAELTKRVREGRQGEEVEGAELGAANPQAIRYDLEVYGFDRTKLRYTSNRTSLIIGPEGVVPPMLPQARERNVAMAAKLKGHEFDGPEQRSLSERCILLNQIRIPMTPAANEGNLLQIVQGPGYVSLLHEIDHSTRVIPTDGRAHVPQNIRLWQGDSVGHWEGNTLVVDTTNFTNLSAYRGSSDNLHLVERFTRAADDTMTYQFTVDDPTTWAKPWTAEIPWTKTKGPVYEWACHEGNTMISTILHGARVEEEAAQKKGK